MQSNRVRPSDNLDFTISSDLGPSKLHLASIATYTTQNGPVRGIIMTLDREGDGF